MGHEGLYRRSCDNFGRQAGSFFRRVAKSGLLPFSFVRVGSLYPTTPSRPVYMHTHTRARPLRSTMFCKRWGAGGATSARTTGTDHHLPRRLIITAPTRFFALHLLLVEPLLDQLARLEHLHPLFLFLARLAPNQPTARLDNGGVHVLQRLA